METFYSLRHPEIDIEPVKIIDKVEAKIIDVKQPSYTLMTNEFAHAVITILYKEKTKELPINLNGNIELNEPYVFQTFH